MKKAYVIFPALAMLIFFGFWWNFTSKYDAAQAEKAKLARAAKEQKLMKEAEERKIAIQQAVAAAEARKKEREAKSAMLQAERDARQHAVEAKDKAYRDKEKLARQAERLEKDISTEKDLIAKLDEKKRILVSDEAFLRQYVTLAESNQQGLQDVLQQIAKADTARALAEAAAARAKKR